MLLGQSKAVYLMLYFTQGVFLCITKHMLFYFSISLTFWRDRVVKDVINKFGGPKSIIKLSSNNLMHNYMFSVIQWVKKLSQCLAVLQRLK